MSVTSESLLRTIFLPLYPEDARADLSRARSVDANPAKNPSILAHLDQAAEVFARNAPAALGVPEGDLALDFTDASIHRLSAALSFERRDRLARDESEGSPDNALFNLVVHGSAYVGACITRGHGGTWAVRRPLWESLVRLTSRAGDAELAVFHWWLKSLADDRTATLADRYRAHVEVPCARPEDLPIIAPPDRKLPKLAKPRYDALYKYLRAHLPELRDVGEDFPSPERFDEIGFKHLVLLLVGGGRMLVVAGPGTNGLHAFWLTRDGFEKAAYWPCDAFPEPIVRAKRGEGDGTDDKIEVVLSRDQKPLAFELLWWGP